MYRYRSYQQVIYGRFNEFLKAWQELSASFQISPPFRLTPTRSSRMPTR